MTYSLFLQADQKKYIIYKIQIITLILNSISVIICIKFGASIQIVKLVSAFIFMLRPILQNLYVRKKYNINFNQINDNYKIEQKWDGFAQHIAYVINNNTDVVILTLCSNLTEVSVYSIYSSIVNSVRNMIQSFANGIDANFGNLIAKNDLKKLNLEFKKFFHFYLFISIICYIITAILIIPFITIYTKGVTDVNYIRPIFAIILILAKFIEVIKKHFNDLVLAKGDFKQTKLGAYIESISNILISLSLVWYFGLIGVAIGTLISTIIRTTEIIIYANKNILKKEKYEKSKYNNTDA
jgi:Na+-driven multidrug efflux pump